MYYNLPYQPVDYYDPYGIPFQDNFVHEDEWRGFQGGFPGQPGGFPSHTGGSPGQPGGFPPSFPGGGQQAGAPTSPPPAFTPQPSATTFAVDPGAIRGCLYRFTYVWLNNGKSFWFYPTFVGRSSVAGFRWRRGRWVYYGTDLRRIISFRCSF